MIFSYIAAEVLDSVQRTFSPRAEGSPAVSGSDTGTWILAQSKHADDIFTGPGFPGRPSAACSGNRSTATRRILESRSENQRRRREQEGVDAFSEVPLSKRFGRVIRDRDSLICLHSQMYVPWQTEEIVKGKYFDVNERQLLQLTILKSESSASSEFEYISWEFGISWILQKL